MAATGGRGTVAGRRAFGVMLAAVLVMPGCALMLNDRLQNVTIITDPPGAACVEVNTAPRAGRHRPLTSATPATVQIRRSREPLVLVCSREGLETTRIRVDAVLSPATIGTFLVFGLAGTLIEAQDDRQYAVPGRIVLTLPPSSRSQPGS